jgi:hypothetical protein
MIMKENMMPNQRREIILAYHVYSLPDWACVDHSSQSLIVISVVYHDNLSES